MTYECVQEIALVYSNLFISHRWLLTHPDEIGASMKTRNLMKFSEPQSRT